MVTNVGDNPSLPLATSLSYNPDQLIAGDEKIVTDQQAVITSGALLTRGTVLGMIASGHTGSGHYKKAVASANDGSQTPIAILLEDADASGGDVTGAVALTGEFNSDRIILDNSISLFDAKNALRDVSIHLKGPVSRSDPSNE